MERSGTNVQFHCLEIIEQNKASCSFRLNWRGRNIVVSDRMGWNLYHSIPLRSIEF